MRTILVDDEIWMMKQFEVECAQIDRIDIVGRFTSGVEALSYARANIVEFALLDIEMPGIGGLELAKQLRDIYPKIIIIFITGHKKYLEEFIHMKADYYVLKPYTKEDIEDALKRAELLSKRLRSSVYIRTFGNFEVFVEGKPVYFNSSKAKELLAYMVDRRGGILNSKEAFSVIWEDRGLYNAVNSAVFRKTIMRLREILERENLGELIIGTSKEKRLNLNMFDCDLYDFLDGDEHTILNFTGEYMCQYSWAENTLCNLLTIKHQYCNY